MLADQGESNSQTRNGNANKYRCQMEALVSDWRSRWHRSDSFAFSMGQLCPAGDGSGGATRIAQQTVTFPSRGGLEGVGMAVCIDLWDAHADCGEVHPRDKLSVGERLARASLALAYRRGAEDSWRGPTPNGMQKHDDGRHVRVTFDFAESLEFRNLNSEGFAPGLGLESFDGPRTEASWLQGFEATTDARLLTGWSFVPATIDASGARPAVVVEVPPGVAGLRYAWGSRAKGEMLYGRSDGVAGADAPVAVSCTVRGSCAEEQALWLPAAPFVGRCPAAAQWCSLVAGGEVPLVVPPPPAPHPPPAPPGSPAPPRPPLPSPQTAGCTFRRALIPSWRDASYRSVSVGLDDYAACCAACRAEQRCVAAQQYHGTGTATFNLCRLFDDPAILTTAQPSDVGPPSTEVVCTPCRLPSGNASSSGAALCPGAKEGGAPPPRGEPAEPAGCDDDCSECCPCDGSWPHAACRDSPYIAYALFAVKWILIVLVLVAACCCVGVAVCVKKRRKGAGGVDGSSIYSDGAQPTEPQAPPPQFATAGGAG